MLHTPHCQTSQGSAGGNDSAPKAQRSMQGHEAIPGQLCSSEHCKILAGKVGTAREVVAQSHWAGPHTLQKVSSCCLFRCFSQLKLGEQL